MLTGHSATRLLSGSYIGLAALCSQKLIDAHAWSVFGAGILASIHGPSEPDARQVILHALSSR